MGSSRIRDIMNAAVGTVASGVPTGQRTPFMNAAARDIANGVASDRYVELKREVRLSNLVADQEGAAKDYVTNHLDAFSANVEQTIGAMMYASNEYNRIMSAQARKPLGGEIFLNLVITLIPVAGPLMRVKKVLEAKEVLTMGEKAGKFLQATDDKLDDLINSIRGPIAASPSEAALDDTQKSATVVNGAIRKELAALFELKQKILDLAVKMRGYILARAAAVRQGSSANTSILADVESVFVVSGLSQIRRVGSDQFQHLCDVMLYSLLKKYVEQHVTFTLSESKFVPGNAAHRSHRLAHLPQYLYESQIEGLNDGQRKEIYRKFGSAWVTGPFMLTGSTSTDYPPIFDYRDIIRHWKNGQVQRNEMTASEKERWFRDGDVQHDMLLM